MTDRHCLLLGRLVHERFLPKTHRFSVPLFFVELDLDDLEQAFLGARWWSHERINLASFRRSDFLDPEILSLKEAVQRRLRNTLGWVPAGRVTLVTHVRLFGLCFNPVSFYLCHDAEDRLAAVVAEITNTPWGERHAYVLGDPQHRSSNGCLHFQFQKTFHVSPFNGMNQTYDWSFLSKGERLTVHMTNREEGRSHFMAHLFMKRQPATARSLDRMLWRFPFLTLRVLVFIYLHAFWLWWKGVPFHEHPKHSAPQGSPASK
jgi:hypothetical protein